MKSETDWTTTDRCPRCNEHGPFLPSGIVYDPEASRELHKAQHGLTEAIWSTTPFRQMLRFIERHS